ncbi:hypothetical protein VTP01DRAFT_8110 [Rhizomucor pusillus]|uniref:uncharacterized protein n=1 Tax=Rhizomucor pusillus TaxID=4840 RepID=UPI003742E31B
MVQPSIPSNLKSFFHIRLSDQHKTDPPPAQHSLSSDEDVMSATIRKKDIDNNVECSSLSSLSSSPTHEEEQMARIETSKSSVQEPYSVFSKSQKIVIVAISSFAGLLSPLSANTYFPALPVIEEELDTTTELVNVTVTVYMIFQGLSPTFWGSLADRWGRRPVYLETMAVYIGANVGLALAPSYAALLVLRMLQAFGSSSVIAIGAGVIGDVATPAERGTYFGVYTTGQMLGLVIGPVLGGIISETISWRWIFWILLILGATLFLITFLFLPETLRSLVGNGSGYANPTPFQWFKRHVKKRQGIPQPPSSSSWRRFTALPNFLEPAKYLFEADVFAMLLYLALHYAVFYAYLVSMPALFAELYGLNQLQVGLCYLVQGFGSVLGSLVGGRLLDRDYTVLARKRGFSEKKQGKLPLDFPIYWARLRTIWIHSGVVQIITIIYGWILSINAHMAAPLVLQFFLGFDTTCMFNGIQTLLIDLFPGKGASISASNNLVRCILGAVASVAIEPGIQGVGVGWMFTILTLILLLSNLSVLFVLKYGPRWRNKRACAAEEEAKANKEESAAAGQ